MTAGRKSQGDASAWDIPVLDLRPVVRRRIYQAARRWAEKEGFVLPLADGGDCLAWSQPRESAIFGRRAFRVWAAAQRCLNEADLGALSERLEAVGAEFAAVSAWHRPAAHPAFRDVGASVHVALRRVRRSAAGEGRFVFRRFGDVPADWIRTIADHVASGRWHDRHACDSQLPREELGRRRSNWIWATLKTGSGFVAIDLDSDGRPLTYFLVPFDHSRQPHGGPMVGGINSVLAWTGRGRSRARALLHAAYRSYFGLADAWIIQYQPTNRPMKALAEEILVGRHSLRHDRHWHQSRHYTHFPAERSPSAVAEPRSKHA